MPSLTIELCERGLIPDRLVRAGMRRLIARRLASPEARDPERRNAHMRALMEHASSGPINEHATSVSEQHQALPPSFFEQMLGPRLKFSGCLFETGIDTLDQAEHAMLALCAQRARLRDGLRILDLGCGWGSFALWAAQRYPHAEIRAIASSAAQRDYIARLAAERKLVNLEVESCDINQFDPGTVRFDRIMAIETLEHLRNYRKLFARIARWLADNGRLFVQVFAHKQLAHALAADQEHGWLPRHFISGGIMPSENLLAHFQNDLILRESWWLSGSHYRDTANAWLARLDAARGTIEKLFSDTYGPAEVRRWFHRWRLLLMSIAELFGYDRGNQWGTAHYLFVARANDSPREDTSA